MSKYPIPIFAGLPSRLAETPVLKDLAKPTCGPYLEGVTNPDRIPRGRPLEVDVGACRTVV